MEPLITASLIAAFVAGLAALFAPCCIAVLLPAYLGSVFRQKSKVFLMTFVFFLGLFVVFLPLGLGIGGLGQFFGKYHNALYAFGGIFLLFLGIFLLLGRHFSLPFSVSVASKTKVQGAGSIFTLGIFSAFATLCCAPVLAGVMALAVLPGSFLWGGLYSLTYALGMVSPLFILAYFLDKNNFNEKFLVFKKQVSYSFFKRKINLAVADIISGATFLSMGAFILYLALTEQLAMRSEYQLTINIFLKNLTGSINKFFAAFPSFVLIAGVVGLLLLILKITISQWKKEQ